MRMVEALITTLAEGIQSASGGRIWDEKKTGARVHPAIRELISLGGTQPGWQGFSSYGHRLGSLYRAQDKTASTLRNRYENKAHPSLLLVPNTEIQA